MPLKPWKVTASEELADVHIFRLLRETSISPRTGAPRQFARLVSPEWVNIIALTAGPEVVLVRQWRHGTRQFALEIPGGLVEPGEGPDRAAARETQEETGYAGSEPVHLGVVEPNPAIHSNRCHTFLIESCRRVTAPQLDAGEDIEVLLRPLSEIPALIARGEIAHALVICGFWWLRQERPDLWT